MYVCMFICLEEGRYHISVWWLCYTSAIVGYDRCLIRELSNALPHNI